ncbi:MAG: hypothetical protein RMM98_14845 [Acidobacteriota bacterium]|nr:hypothetical protein [Blastocatellia bacterium]MDW8240885.1 hypothetical protein [Acidobacteriota bacterium]
MSNLQQRMIRAARLDVSLYEEVERDPMAMGQAMTVVILSSVAAGIGSISTLGVKGLVLGTIAGLVGWFIWAYLTYYIGTRWFAEPQTRATHGELLRTIGFASAPGVIRVLGVIPVLGWIASLVGSILMLIAMVVAVRQALDYSTTGRAVVVCLIGWIAYMVIGWLAVSIFGGLARPFF